MANLDISELFDDPDFASSFDVKRRQEVVGTNGRATTTDTLHEGITGSVWPSEPSNQQRTEDYETSFRVIEIATSFRLRAASTGFKADIVIWEGIEYTVKAVKNFTRYGSGFVHATAESVASTDAPLS